MGDELVDFLEGAGIEEQVDALARGELAASCWRRRRSSPPPSSARRSSAASCLGVVHRALRLAGRRLRLLPILQELLETDVSERMLEHRLDHRGRARHDVGTHPRGLHHVNRMPDAGDEHLVVKS